MNESTKKLLDLINNNKTLNEICTELNRTPKQIFNHLTMLKNKGMIFQKNYLYATGDITYSSTQDFNADNKPNLIIPEKCPSIKAVAISDTHLGSYFERLDLLNEIYNYCTKNSITTIFHCGDIIDNNVNNFEKVPTEEKVEYLLKNYPYDKNVITYIVLGNHDLGPLKNQNINLAILLENYRHDMVQLGYMQGMIKMKKDGVTLFHSIGSKGIDEEKEPTSVYLMGHSHIYNTYNSLYRSSLKIKVPSLSNLKTSPISYPSALELELSFKDEMISFATVRQLIYNGVSFIPINEMQYSIDNKEILKAKRFSKTLSK